MARDAEPAEKEGRFQVENATKVQGLRPRLIAMGYALAALRHPGRSVSGKLMLVVMLTTAIALAVAGAGLLLTDVRDNRQAWADDLDTEASILALATAPALSFNDREGAARNLAALQARASIRVAALYTPDGALYAQYARAGQTRAARRIPALSAGVHIARDGVELLRPIVQNGETLGAIYLRAHYDMTGRMKSYAGVLGIVLVLSLAVALIASGWLQHVITNPMASMAVVARSVVGRGDYSLRAPKTTGDEIGLVVDAFNNMLDEVQARTRALEEANTALQDEMAVRLATEHALRESEKLYRAIGESIDYGVWLCDATGRNTYTSDSYLRLIGITQAECSGFRWGDTLHPEDREAVIIAWKECVRTGGNWYREHRVLGADGAYHAILAQGVPVRDESGRITRWAGINLDISRLKRTEQALREADRRKDEFLATLAHELRNPLAPIRNAVQLLDLPTADDRQRRWGRDVIARQVRHMALLLDDLLDVSRITRGQLELKKDFVDLQSVVDVAIETARPLLEAKRHALTTSLPPKNVRLEADPLRLSQILGNLLTNAAKYTDPDGQITLSASVSESALVLSVKDTGIGLSPETIPGLFTMFSQVNSAIDRTEGGLGIGLGLVKGLVNLHGGSVEARSDGLGHGSEFIVYLPPSVVVLPPTESSSVAHSAGVVKVRAPGRVLVADDNRDGAESLATLLELSGYEVATAFSGPEALEVALRERPHAILLDIGMPGLTGYEVARRIRREAWGRHAILIALTGWGQEDDKQRSKAAGFDAHLTKPVDPGEVDRILAELLIDSNTSSAGDNESQLTER